MFDSTKACEDARALLQTPEPAASPWATLAAAGFAALAAVLMAGAVILGPGFEVDGSESMSSWDVRSTQP